MLMSVLCVMMEYVVRLLSGSYSVGVVWIFRTIWEGEAVPNDDRVGELGSEDGDF